MTQDAPVERFSSTEVCYRHMSVAPMTAALGAEIDGIDLSRPLLDAVFDEIHRALLDRQVIFFRNQDITPAQLSALARRFGPVETHHYYRHVADHPEISVLEPEPDGPLNLWHTDGSYRRTPAMGALLHAQEIPDYGGDTLWASLTASYDALSDQLKTLLSGLTARHDFARTYQDNFLAQADGLTNLQKAREDMPPVEHPVIRVHPVTGKKALFVNPNYVTEIIGLSRQESDALLAMLFHHQQLPEFQLRWRWREKSLAIWDNRATMHYAVQDYAPKYRRMHRVAISGNRPF